MAKKDKKEILFLILLFVNINVSNVFKLLISDGRISILFDDKSKWINRDKFDNSVGIDPLKSFDDKSK